MGVVSKWIAQTLFVIHEEADRIDLQFINVKSGRKTDLHRKLCVPCVGSRAKSLCLRIKPFFHASVRAEPHRMVLGVIWAKGRESRDT
jgi:hypothetical protein